MENNHTIEELNIGDLILFHNLLVGDIKIMGDNHPWREDRIKTRDKVKAMVDQMVIKGVRDGE